MDANDLANGDEQQAGDSLSEQMTYLETSGPDEIYNSLWVQVPARVGSEYQVEVPNLLSADEQMRLRSAPLNDGSPFGFEYPVGLGLPIPIMRLTIAPNSDIKKDEKESLPIINSSTECMKENSDTHGVISKSSVCKSEHSSDKIKLEGRFDASGEDIGILQAPTCRRESRTLAPFPGSAAASWGEVEEQSFLLGLYIFGKNLIRVRDFVGSKTTGDVLSYYYGKFYRSDGYKRWAECRRIRSRRCILGPLIFTGSRQQELISRLLAVIPTEAHDTLLEVFKVFHEDKTTYEEFIFHLKSTVGVQVLIDAIGIGKGKHDLTGMVVDPGRSNQAAANHPEIPAGKACSSLTPGDIIKFLTGGFRLSKAKSNDLFWEAVWPRLLDRGWHSEQPKDVGVGSKHALVFLIPGIKKFSRKKLVKGNHYFDSVSDVLSKVASEPRLLELKTEGDNDDNGTMDEIDNQQQRHCYLRPRLPDRTPELMKFMVVDTSMVYEEPFRVRSLRSLPADFTWSFGSSSQLRETRSNSLREQSDSDEDSSSDEQMISGSQTERKELDGSKDSTRPVEERVLSNSSHDTAAVSGTALPINGHISKVHNFSISDGTDLLPEAKHPSFSISSGPDLLSDTKHLSFSITNSSNLPSEASHKRRQLEPMTQGAFHAPVSKRSRLSACRGERVGRRNFPSTKVRDQINQESSQVAKKSCPKLAPLARTTSGPCSVKVRPLSDSNLTSGSDLCPPPPSDQAHVSAENSSDHPCIDLNLPQPPSDMATSAAYTMPLLNKTDGSAETSEIRQPENVAVDKSSSDVLAEQHSSSQRRQSTRSRPPTAKALEALACGFIGMKRKGRDQAIPSVGRSSRRPSRRPRMPAPPVSSLAPPDYGGSSFSFTDSTAVDDHRMQMTNPNYGVPYSGAKEKYDSEGASQMPWLP